MDFSFGIIDVTGDSSGMFYLVKVKNGNEDSFFKFPGQPVQYLLKREIE